MKACVDCGELKSLTEFYGNHKAADGRGSKCKACDAAYGRRWRAANQEREWKRRRLYRAANPELVRSGKRPHNRRRNPERRAEYQRQYRARNREKIQARSAVQGALKSGELSRPQVCSQCALTGPSGRLEAHHDNYHRPLDVLWLCPVCHAAIHDKQFGAEEAA